MSLTKKNSKGINIECVGECPMYVHANFQDTNNKKVTSEEVELFDQPSYSLLFACLPCMLGILLQNV